MIDWCLCSEFSNNYWSYLKKRSQNIAWSFPSYCGRILISRSRLSATPVLLAITSQDSFCSTSSAKRKKRALLILSAFGFLSAFFRLFALLWETFRVWRSGLYWRLKSQKRRRLYRRFNKAALEQTNKKQRKTLQEAFGACSRNISVCVLCS